MLDTVFFENWIFYLDIGGWISANAFYTCRPKLIAYCVEQRQTIAGKSNKIFDISLISFHQIFMRITRTHRGPWRTEDGLPLFLCRNIFQPNSICREENANILCINSPSSAPPKRKTNDWCREETGENNKVSVQRWQKCRQSYHYGIRQSRPHLLFIIVTKSAREEKTDEHLSSISDWAERNFKLEVTTTTAAAASAVATAQPFNCFLPLWVLLTDASTN